MDEENTTAALRPETGVATLVFGISPLNEHISRLNLGGVVLQGDCRTVSAVQLAQSNVRRAVCTLFPMGSDRQNDAVSVIEALGLYAYSGDVWVLAPPLLRPKMVESELRGLARGMSLRLMAGHLPPLTEI